MKMPGTSAEIYWGGASPSAPPLIERNHRIELTATEPGISGDCGDKSGLTWYNHITAAWTRDRVSRVFGVATFKFSVIRMLFGKLCSLLVEVSTRRSFLAMRLRQFIDGG